MFDKDQIPSLRETIERYDLRAKKSLGQNFLLDRNITDKIVHQAFADVPDISNITVLEIGPGPGGLTRSLLSTNVQKVVAVEYDPRAIKVLQDLKAIAGDRLEIIHADARTLDLIPLSRAPRAIVANLPYNIATPLLTRWLKQISDDRSNFLSMTLMFQKEVAQRITAPPGSKTYGRLSVLAQWLCQAIIVYDLPPAAFTPPPKVSSSVVRFVPKPARGQDPAFETIEAVTAAAFGQRRKMIRSSLKDYIAALEACDIDITKRAENLTMQDFLNIARQHLS